MTIIYAPIAGKVQQLNAVGDHPYAHLGAQGPAIAILPEFDPSARNVVLVAPVTGTVLSVEPDRVAIAPELEAPALETVREVHVFFDAPSEQQPVGEVTPGQRVVAGDDIVRWKLVDKDQESTFVVVLRDPEGQVTCDRVDAMVYAGEPLLTVVGEDDGRVSLSRG